MTAMLEGLAAEGARDALVESGSGRTPTFGGLRTAAGRWRRTWPRGASAGRPIRRERAARLLGP